MDDCAEKARLRRERREQRILSQGSSRLSKITQTAHGESGADYADHSNVPTATVKNPPPSITITAVEDDILFTPQVDPLFGSNLNDLLQTELPRLSPESESEPVAPTKQLPWRLIHFIGITSMTVYLCKGESESLGLDMPPSVPFDLPILLWFISFQLVIQAARILIERNVFEFAMYS